MDVPKQLQDKLAQYQNLQSQLQLIAMQKQQLMLQDADVKNAQKELEGFTKGKIYRMAGSLIIESSKDECDKKLSEDTDLAKTRITVLEKQEKKMVEKLNQMRTDLQSMMGQQQPPI